MTPSFPARRQLTKTIRRIGFPAAIVMYGATATWIGWAAPAPDANGNPAAKGPSTSAISYGRDIRPLLSDRCFLCHGPDEAKREGGLRLDIRAEAVRERDGVQAIAPGDLEASELWYRIGTEDPSEAMPPPESHRKRFTASEVDLLGRWIEQGAPYEEHWSFQAPKRTNVPRKTPNPIDAFLLDAMDSVGLAANDPAEPELALRRLFLDLTGLPPTLEEIRSFQKESETAGADRAWGQFVQKLFTEEPYKSRYAERMTTPWLDQARYADTIGIHTDAGRQLWPWRDWVLRAYRDNMPFDQFLTEQLAGDLFPNATVDQKIATGFLRSHVVTDEGGAIDEEYLVEYAVDRVDTTAQVFLGLTVSCARCHDHKFDPISQEDYYKLFAFFASNDEPGLYTQESDPNRAFEPFLEVPTAKQSYERTKLTESIAAIELGLTTPTPQENEQLAQFRAELPDQLGLDWSTPKVLSATSEEGATMTIAADATVLAEGKNPETDTHQYTLRTDETDLRLLQLDVLGHASLTNGAPGRAGNGNGVLTGLHVTAVSSADPTQTKELSWSWIWTDFAQDNEDYTLLRAFEHGPNKGWAIGGHEDPVERVALLLADEPFGFDGGTELKVTLEYRSQWARHVFGRVRIATARLAATSAKALPVTQGHWYHLGPFPVTEGSPYETSFGPETQPSLDWEQTVEANGPKAWTYRPDFIDGESHALPDGINVHYVAREIYSPTARELPISIGSDDGFAIYCNGTLVSEREVPRGVEPDQDQVIVPLQPGRNSLVFKVINTGGAAGFYYSANQKPEVLTGGLVFAILDQSARRDAGAAFNQASKHAWRLAESDTYREGVEGVASLKAEQATLEAAIAKTMVMQDRMEPREVFVLDRGEYDKPDANRRVRPDIPTHFGTLATQGTSPPSTRLDLARWMVQPTNPLVARVAVNRLWQQIFGSGLVSTSGDFGYQGAWPSHPELMDWLAVEFIDSGWDVQHMLKLMVTSDAYRSQSAPSAQTRDLDPENRWLTHFPRRRLDGERIRDLALYVSGLLHEEFGGPPVKPYQPSGLWAEVAMTASNTRFFQQGMGNDLWRRSLYTYWKRACPPPSLMAFDAPTRESCVVQRGATNTPIQALVLWNDEQFREAARVLAARTLAENADASTGLAAMFQRCTGRTPTVTELELLEKSLVAAQAEYRDRPEAADAWLSAGAKPLPMEADKANLAAWTMVASAILNLHATLTNG